MLSRILTGVGVALALAVTAVAPAKAVLITEYFYATTSDGGIGSAVVTINHTSGTNTMTVQIDNTTPNLTIGGQTNSSVITGFGFDMIGPASLPSISSWSLNAFNKDCALNLPGCDSVDLTSMYTRSYSSGFGGIFGPPMDYLFKASNGINGGIFNAASMGNITGNVYSDTGVLMSVLQKTTLTINFASAFTLTSIPMASLRMQRVGINGAGSLKILATEEQIMSASEPGTLALFGIGLATIYMRRRASRKPKSTERSP